MRCVGFAAEPAARNPDAGRLRFRGGDWRHRASVMFALGRRGPRRGSRVGRCKSRRRVLFNILAIAFAVELLTVRACLCDALAVRDRVGLGAFKWADARRWPADRIKEIKRRLVECFGEARGFGEFRERQPHLRRRPIAVDAAASILLQKMPGVDFPRATGA